MRLVWRVGNSIYSMMAKIQQKIIRLLESAGVTGQIELTTPPNPEMGDVALACFGLAKEWKMSPAEAAKELVSKLGNGEMAKSGDGFIERIEAAGPYVNFFVNANRLAEEFFGFFSEEYGSLDIGSGKKYLVEFGCPNPLKAFHLGHLKNLISGESIARILENAGYTVRRINYQGDVGLHIAKAMWAIQDQMSEVRDQKSKSLGDRLAFLGQLYARGAKAFEENEEAKKEILAMNKRVYAKDPAIQELYSMTVAWSFEYFDDIYKRLNTRFDRLYMESEVFGPGEQIVRENLKKGMFKESQGAIIYEGSKYGLHDRVFINSEGLPTYEAKDLGLAQAHFTDHNPDKVIHVVGKEQGEYFKVVFKAIGEIWPGREEKEFHLPGGFLQLKEGKMSSRTGNVVLGDELLTRARDAVSEIMHDRQLPEKEQVIEKIAVAAVKYAILKVSVSDDVAFDMKSSVSFEGDSGPYLLYIVARIKSILKKSKIIPTQSGQKSKIFVESVEPTEKRLLLSLGAYPEITKIAVETLDPSVVAQYLFHLAQTFNTFYHQCPVLQAEAEVQQFRVRLIQAVESVMAHGLHLLGIDIVDEM